MPKHKKTITSELHQRHIHFSRINLGIITLIFAVIGAIILIHSFAAPNPNLPGDLNGDNTVNGSDLSILLADYNTTNTAADINGDGHVNILDLSILLAHYGQSVTVTTSGGTPGIGLNQQGGSLGLIANPNLYSMVIADNGDHLSTLQNVAGRGLAYFNGTDVKQSFSTGVTYTQALNNGWLLTCGTGYCVNSQFSSYGADVGSAGYQQAWIANVLAFLTAHPGIKGIFIDNVIYDPKADFGGVYPDKYPSTSAWDTAMVSFVKAVYPALHGKGYYVALNGGAYKSGDATYNDGTSTINWWNMIGPYSSGLMNENYMETTQGLRANGTAWYQLWSGWQRLIGTAQSMGKDFIGLMHSPDCTNTTWMTYGKASFMLEWNGGGSVYMYSGGQCDPTNPAWTTDNGTPTAAKVAVGVGWERSYTKGTVLVNPSPTASQTFTVNGTSYTLAPTTARIL